MPPRSRRLAFPSHAVTAVVVSHDGVQWLPDCLDGLRTQTRPPQRVVAVDTGSGDGSADLAAAVLGTSALVRQPRTTGLGAAVRAGLAAFDGEPPAAARRGGPLVEWVWILHDDCAPDPDALGHLLARADESASIAAVVPKQLSRDGRHLLELGATVDSSGTRDTGIDPREVDQGQHDNVDGVLCGSTAGLLVRRDVWDRLGGLDDTWGLFGADVDLGWRINAGGERVVAAPRAVLRHAAALTTGARRADAVPIPAGAARRLHGMQVVLANTSPWLVPLLAVRYVLEGLLRCLTALFLMRSPRRARDEVLAAGLLVARPSVVVRARRRRRATRQVPHRELRRLLAPPGRRWRHALDHVVRTRHPVPSARSTEPGPVAAEAESFAVDDARSLVGLLTRPVVLMTVALLVVALVADRSLLGGDLGGGQLLPAPGGASDLWHRYTSDWHPVELGSTTVAPPGLAVLALLATLLLGKPWLVVDVLVLGAVPLAGLAAYAGAARLVRRRGLRAAGAAAYAVTPPILAAVAGGRLDVVVVAVLAPLVLRAVGSALGSGSTPAAARAALLLTLTAAFAPVVWPTAVVGGLVAAAVGPRRGAAARTTVFLALVPAVLLLPWTVDLVRSPHLLAGALGLPSRAPQPSGIDLLLLHAGSAGEPPAWVWAPLVAIGLLAVAFARRAGRFGVVAYLLGVGGALLLSRRGVDPVAALVVAAAGAVAAAVVTVDVAPAALRRRAFGWRQLGVAVLAAAAVVATVGAGVTWAVRGAGAPLTANAADVLPVFAQAEAAASTAPRVLVLRPVGAAISYALLQGPHGLRLGDAAVAPSAHAHRVARRALDQAVADAVAARPGAAGELAGFGISLLVVRGEDRGAVAGLRGADRLARVPATTSVVYRSAIRTGEAVVLTGDDAAAARAGRPLPPTAQPRPLPATPGAVSTRVAAGGSGGLLVLAEPHSSAWHATVDGHRLRPVTAYGWAQAWPLPATGGSLRVWRADGSRRWWLAGEAAATVLVLLSCVSVRREDGA